MKQYEYSIGKVTLTGISRNTVLCTAQTEEKARAAVRAAYSPEFIVSDAPISERPPHHIYGEIDATA